MRIKNAYKDENSGNILITIIYNILKKKKDQILANKRLTVKKKSGLRDLRELINKP